MSPFSMIVAAVSVAIVTPPFAHRRRLCFPRASRLRRFAHKLRVERLAGGFGRGGHDAGPRWRASGRAREPPPAISRKRRWGVDASLEACGLRPGQTSMRAAAPPGSRPMRGQPRISDITD